MNRSNNNRSVFFLKLSLIWDQTQLSSTIRLEMTAKRRSMGQNLSIKNDFFTIFRMSVRYSRFHLSWENPIQFEQKSVRELSETVFDSFLALLEAKIDHFVKLHLA